MSPAVMAPTSNWPAQPASFVGRNAELKALESLLESSRLLTLTGPGGCGKTRLSLQLARLVSDRFSDGVCFVPLAPVRNADLVPSTIAQSLGLQDSSDRPLEERLVNYLRGRDLLLLLDNFEHVIAAASLVAKLLEQAEKVRILVSSRAPLRIRGEQEFPVPPLELPAEGASWSAVAASESVRLFVARARAVVPEFELTEESAPFVAGIGRRLDGLPLAIELAAVRVRLLPPESLLRRLDHSLTLLTSGARDVPDRQQTLRSTIAWSYDLLSPDGRRLLAACSVFRGGISLEAIETVGAAPLPNATGVLDSLEELVEQSLLRPVPGETPRFLMLETIREFAAEHLEDMAEAEAIKDAHAATFLALAETAEPALTGPHEDRWLAQLELEHNNLRTALERYRDTDPPRALRLAVLLSPFWSFHGHFTEARARLADLLSTVPDRSRDRVAALCLAGTLAVDQADYPNAFARLEEALGLARELGDRRGEARALLYYGRSAIASGNPQGGSTSIDQGLALAREVEDRPVRALGLIYAGLVALFTNHPGEAADLFGQALEASRALGHRSMTAHCLQILAHARVDLGDLAGARQAVAAGLPVSLELGHRFVVQIGLTALAGVAVSSARPARALKLAGATAGYCEREEVVMPFVLRIRLEQWVAKARQALGRAADRPYAEGKAMSLGQAIDYALAGGPEEPPPPGHGSGLTRRELEVARLVAIGLSNREIASRLFLSVRTVEVHVDHALTKLGYNNRTQLAAWAYEQGLLPENT